MAHLVAPRPADPDLPVFFNVDGAVGAPPAPNQREDVLLVQFAFSEIATSPHPTTDPGLLAAARAVRLTGSMDPATLTAIQVQQERWKKTLPGTVVDGRVSPARDGYAYGDGFWSIVNLNESLQDRHRDVWPRIDKIPGCPPELQQMVIRTVVGQ